MEVKALNPAPRMQQPRQELPCPSQTLLFDLLSNTHLPHQRHPPHNEVNVYLCLTCGSPVFRDDGDNEQDSDLTSPFCSDCFSSFSRDSFTDLYGDASMTGMDDDDDDDDDYDYDEHEDCNYFHDRCHAGSISLQGSTLPLALGSGYSTRDNTSVTAI